MLHHPQEGRLIDPQTKEVSAPDMENPLAHYSRSERADLLEYAGEFCTNRQRLLLILRYGEGRTLNEIAAHLDVSLSAAKQMHARALITLAKAFRRLGIKRINQIL
jgi:RNA polymerase sigma factor (sigma-70 family)